MLKTRTISRVIVIHNEIDLALIPIIADKKYAQAALCLKDFFLQYPDAFGAGVYEVEMYKTLPKMHLIYDVFKLAA